MEKVQQRDQNQLEEEAWCPLLAVWQRSSNRGAVFVPSLSDDLVSALWLRAIMWAPESRSNFPSVATEKRFRIETLKWNASFHACGSDLFSQTRPQPQSLQNKSPMRLIRSLKQCKLWTCLCWPEPKMLSNNVLQIAFMNNMWGFWLRSFSAWLSVTEKLIRLQLRI